MKITVAIECPCCNSLDFRVAVPRAEIRWETEIREDFIRQRTNGRTHGDDLKDRTNFAHNRVVDLLECNECGLLIRDDLNEDFAKVYADDSYESEVLEQFLERDIRFFSQKEGEYRPLLNADAKIIEIGSYAGGFLHVAQAWRWQAKGVDIGKDVSRFANDKGYETYLGAIEDMGLPDGSVDGIFIWNCFDQLVDPQRTLEEVFRILKSEGVLVIRTPNALFYRLCRPILKHAASRDDTDMTDKTITKVMGYNNLLGFPYQYGYEPRHHRLMLEQSRFELERFIPSSLLMLPESEAPAWAIEEQHAIIDQMNALELSFRVEQEDEVISPWLELIARKSDK